jgi:hypothetical protein
MKSGSLRAIPGPPKFTTACGTSRWMTVRRPSPCGTTGASGLSSALAGSAPKVRSMREAAVAASMSPTIAILRLSRANARAV